MSDIKFLSFPLYTCSYLIFYHLSRFIILKYRGTYQDRILYVKELTYVREINMRARVNEQESESESESGRVGVCTFRDEGAGKKIIFNQKNARNISSVLGEIEKLYRHPLPCSRRSALPANKSAPAVCRRDDDGRYSGGDE